MELAGGVCAMKGVSVVQMCNEGGESGADVQ